MKAKKQGLKEFAVQVSGTATFYVKAKNEDDALERYSKMYGKKLFEVMELQFDVIEGADDHG